ncbi:C4-dicarboxylate ABC transporter substrate-binding protein [Marinobacterium nitratireducens]|uniref:C4-dicarboxylate ABC transporter substrate-binding protein n=1 Tax=Marinobacterium nitratireducens TaxID=518897 RepID=A0A917ZJ95_9GAMM|nr:TAXI family TRAP transporter solute-binding subunit [Marinobacterium nitratireducens]GGO84464.1 C4-dicarboxylate ABC transporter substrate-binding protein [Marinobacterium nitratireducens]
MYKRLFCITALTASMLAGPATAAERVSIGTGGTGGLFYVIGAGISDVINKHLADTTARAEVTGASVENNHRVASGQMTLGLSSSSTLYEAKHGEGPFNVSGALDVAAIAYLYPAVLQVATIDGEGISTFEDLKGKRVSMGPPGSNAAVLATRLLEEYGIFGDITPRFLSYTEGVQALVSGQVDATVVLAGAPTAALIDLDSQKDMKLLSADPARLAGITEKYPFYQSYTLPAGTYPDITEPVTLINDPAILFTSGKEDQTQIYNITKSVFDHLDELGAVHPQAAKISLETATSTPVPLHPGAEKYFNEVKGQ